MLHRPSVGVCYVAIFPDAWMMSGEEGKLLAGAAGFYSRLFYSPWGSERKSSASVILRRGSFS
jgi:hypothetical protein